MTLNTRDNAAAARLNSTPHFVKYVEQNSDLHRESEREERQKPILLLLLQSDKKENVGAVFLSSRGALCVQIPDADAALNRTNERARSGARDASELRRVEFSRGGYRIVSLGDAHVQNESQSHRVES